MASRNLSRRRARARVVRISPPHVAPTQPRPFVRPLVRDVSLRRHAIYAQLVCLPGKWYKKGWRGPHGGATRECFERWAENLFLGINDDDYDDDDDDDGGTTAISKMRKTIEVQRDGGYQNEFLFAERSPETVGLWDELRRP